MSEENLIAGCPSLCSSSISSIVYTILDGNQIPVKTYYGIVQFIPETEKSLRIVCEACFNPSLHGSVLCSGGFIIHWILHYAFKVINTAGIPNALARKIMNYLDFLVSFSSSSSEYANNAPISLWYKAVPIDAPRQAGTKYNKAG